jgi:hypothetical protein
MTVMGAGEFGLAMVEVRASWLAGNDLTLSFSTLSSLL